MILLYSKTNSQNDHPEYEDVSGRIIGKIIAIEDNKSENFIELIYHLNFRRYIWRQNNQKVVGNLIFPQLFKNKEEFIYHNSYQNKNGLWIGSFFKLEETALQAVNIFCQYFNYDFKISTKPLENLL